MTGDEWRQSLTIRQHRKKGAQHKRPGRKAKIERQKRAAERAEKRRANQ